MTDLGACIQGCLAPYPSDARCGHHLVIKGNTTHKARAKCVPAIILPR